MDFGRTQLTGLLNNTVHEKAKFLGLLHKLKTLLGVCKGHKLILSRLDKIIITASPVQVYNHINYKHPLVQILNEYLQRAGGYAGGPEYFVNAVQGLIGEINFLLESGIKPKKISDILRDIKISDGAENHKTDADAVIDGDAEIETLPGIDRNCASAKKGAVPDKSEGEECIVPGYVSESVRTVIRRVLCDDHLANLLIECIENTKSYDPERIRICKVPTGCFDDSYRLNGMILNRRPEGRVAKLMETTVGIFNCPLDIDRTELKGKVLFRDHKDLLDFTKNETSGVKDFVDKLNVNVLVVYGKIDKLFMEFVNKRNIMVLKVFSKFDLKRICDAVEGSISNNLGPVSLKGHAKEISAFGDAGYSFTRIVGGLHLNTIVIKNSVSELLDEKERVILELLDSLKNRKYLAAGASTTDLSDDAFHSRVAQAIGTDGAIRAHISKGVEQLSNVKMFKVDKLRVLSYALEFLGQLLEIDDYLVAKKDVLDIKPPQHQGHWDEDH